MQKTVVMQLRAWLSRPTVVHRLPGRLRLRVPALRRLSGSQQECAWLVRDLLQMPPQIQSVDVNLTTGSVLIRYAADALTEAEVLGLLESANRFVLRYWDRLAATPPGELPQVLNRLQEVAANALHQRPALDEDIEIPDHVWA
jgi:hypothetical protein